MACIAILGFGNIGSGVAELLLRNRKAIADASGESVYVKYVLDKRDLSGTGYEDRVAESIEEIVNDPEVTVVCEMMGGTQPAFDFSMAALKKGKSVVTSNKAVVAKYGVELIQTAKENGVYYLYEASVGGGIPIMHAFNDSLRGLKVKRIDGILNGTTNYILTRMHDCSSGFEEALAEAKRLGYAEADPTADVSGADACRKICILAAVAWGGLVPFEKVYCKGIAEITAKQNDFAVKCGGALKLVGTAQKEDDSIYLTVSPAVVLQSNPLSSVSGVFNAVKVYDEDMGELMFYGMGAGKYPTSCAVISDIIVATGSRSGVSGQKNFFDSNAPLIKHEDALENYCIAVKVDKETVSEKVKDYCILSEENGVVYLLCERMGRSDLQSAFDGFEILELMRAIV